MRELDKRTDRIMANRLCLLPPRQACAKSNACLTCDKFATDATFLPEHHPAATSPSAHRGTAESIHNPDRTAVGEDSVWLAGRRQEQDALGRIIPKLELTRLADGPPQAVRGVGVDARTDAITRSQDGS
ncbi:hypothetical protein [Streptomyces sp. NPDC048710]|uniref:hypothetical protein n=1 Tax=Streptomyces sp. NPDC048710 TaxID=3365586 RepID=UPI00371BC667